MVVDLVKETNDSTEYILSSGAEVVKPAIQTETLNEYLLGSVPSEVQALVLSSEAEIDMNTPWQIENAPVSGTYSNFKRAVVADSVRGPVFLLEAVQGLYDYRGHQTDPNWKKPEIRIFSGDFSGDSWRTYNSADVPFSTTKSRYTNYGAVAKDECVTLSTVAGPVAAVDRIGGNGFGLKGLATFVASTLEDRIRILREMKEDAESTGCTKREIQSAIYRLEAIAEKNPDRPHSVLTIQCKDPETNKYYCLYFYRESKASDSSFKVKYLFVPLNSVPEEDKDQVVVTMHNLTPYDVTQLRDLPRAALWCDPKYPHPKNITDENTSKVEFETKRVEFEYGNQKHSVYVELLPISEFEAGVYLDGIRLTPTDHTRTILPWNIKTLGDAKLRALFRRSDNSVFIDGPVGILLQEAIHERTNPEDLQYMIRANSVHDFGRRDERLPIEYSPMNRYFQKSNFITAFQSVWKKEMGDVKPLTDISLENAGRKIGLLIPEDALQFSALYSILQHAKIGTMDDDIQSKLDSIFHIGMRGNINVMSLQKAPFSGDLRTNVSNLFTFIDGNLPRYINSMLWNTTAEDGVYVLKIELPIGIGEKLIGKNPDKPTIRQLEMAGIMQQMLASGLQVAINNDEVDMSVAKVNGEPLMAVRRGGSGSRRLIIEIRGGQKETDQVRQLLIEQRPSLQKAQMSTLALQEAISQGTMSVEQQTYMQNLLEHYRAIPQEATSTKQIPAGSSAIIVESALDNEISSRPEQGNKVESQDILWKYSQNDTSIERPDYFPTATFEYVTLQNSILRMNSTSGSYWKSDEVSKSHVYDPKRNNGLLQKGMYRYTGVYELCVPLVGESNHIVLPVDGKQFEIVAIQYPVPTMEQGLSVQYNPITQAYVVMMDPDDPQTANLDTLPVGTRIYIRPVANKDRQLNDFQYLAEHARPYLESLLTTDVTLDDLDDEARDLLHIINESISPKDYDARADAVYQFWEKRRIYDSSGSLNETIPLLLKNGTGVCVESGVGLLVLMRLAKVYTRGRNGTADNDRNGVLRNSSGHIVVEMLGNNGNWRRYQPPNSTHSLEFLRKLHEQIRDGKRPVVREAPSLSRRSQINVARIPTAVQKKIDEMMYRGRPMSQGLVAQLNAIHDNRRVKLRILLQNMIDSLGKVVRAPIIKESRSNELKALEAQIEYLRMHSVSMTSEEIQLQLAEVMSKVLGVSQLHEDTEI